MRTRGQAWPVRGAAGEGSSLKDQILQEEYELPLIGISRVSGQRGSERDVARKGRHFHAGAMGQHVCRKRQGDECMPNRFPILFSFSFSSSPVGPSGAREFPKTTRRLICEAKHWRQNHHRHRSDSQPGPEFGPQISDAGDDPMSRPEMNAT
jgi:hypothetical protein